VRNEYHAGCTWIVASVTNRDGRLIATPSGDLQTEANPVAAFVFAAIFLFVFLALVSLAVARALAAGDAEGAQTAHRQRYFVRK
jgi:hypothetical protein